MKRFATVLVLLTLPLIPSAQCLVEPPAAAAPGPSVTGAEDFLATLAAGQSAAPDLAGLLPAPTFLTTCTDDSECPPGQLCCYPCGIDGCDFVCMVPPRPHRCPFFP